MSSFTGGKWEYYEPLGVICNEERGIAQVYDAGHDEKYCKPTREGEANARLIAHAPEMYGYLVQVVNDYDLDPDLEGDIMWMLKEINGGQWQ